jgi:hypothetical protein
MLLTRLLVLLRMGALLRMGDLLGMGCLLRVRGPLLLLLILLILGPGAPLVAVHPSSQLLLPVGGPELKQNTQS